MAPLGDPPDDRPRRGGAASVAAVAGVVLLNLFAAWLLSFGAGLSTANPLLPAAVIGAVVLVNIGRIAVWSIIHRRFALSRSYPLTALFFPLVALMSWWHGDRLPPMAIVGVAIITLGVLWHAVMVPEE